MKRLRILITNIALSGRSGTETVARDLALGLLKRGHLPILYSPLLSLPGQAAGVAEDIREALIPVTSNLNTISEIPDIIHGNHFHETMTACLHFPTVPAVWTCHSWDGPHDKVPQLPNLKRFIAIDETCYERLVCEESVESSSTSLIPNCVNLTKFQKRPPLPSKPRKALVLSHYAYADSEWYQNVQKACELAGLTLETYGAGVGKITKTPEKLFKEFDIVFAVDRTALEASVVGCAVILLGQPGLGPMVKLAQCESLYRQNFGRKWLNKEASAENILAEINSYDAQDALAVCEYMRGQADEEKYFKSILGLYEAVITESQKGEATPDANTLLSIAANYCAQLSTAVRESIFGDAEKEQLKSELLDAQRMVQKRNGQFLDFREEIGSAGETLEKAKAERAKLQTEIEARRSAEAVIVEKLRAAESELAIVNEELERLRNSRTMVIKDRMFKMIGRK